VERIFWVSTHCRGAKIGVAATENYVGELEVVLERQEMVLQQRGWCCSNGDGVAATGMVLQQQGMVLQQRGMVLQQRGWCCSNRDGVAATGNGVAATGMVLQQQGWCCSNRDGVAATEIIPSSSLFSATFHVLSAKSENIILQSLAEIISY